MFSTTLLVFFYLWQTFDRQKDLLSRVLRSHWLLHWPITSSWTSPKQNLSQIASRIFVLFLFYKNMLIYNLKFFIFMKYELLTPFLVSWRKFTEEYPKLLPLQSVACWLFSCTYYKTIDVSKTFSWCSAIFGHAEKK